MTLGEKSLLLPSGPIPTAALTSFPNPKPQENAVGGGGGVGCPDHYQDAVRLILREVEYPEMITSFPMSFLPSVSPVSENQVASSEGCVLFYQLMQEPPRVPVTSLFQPWHL